MTTQKSSTFEHISIEQLYFHCYNNIPRVREILAPLTNFTLIEMSDYAWDKLDLI